MRKIIHIDMDAFYASVEQRDNPDLMGKPVVVGGSPERRGVVAAASYEARVFGIHSALPMSRAVKLCRDLVIVPPRHGYYSQVSQQIIKIYRRYTDIVEPLSLDECFLDVTENKKNIPFATEIARQLKQLIKNKLRLTASAGVAPNKFLAKIASDFNKPDGLTVVRPEQVEKFLSPLPIKRMWGVGKKTAERMKELGISTIGDLLTFHEDQLIEKFGKAGKDFFKLARGQDHRPVQPFSRRKSISQERTFDTDTLDTEFLIAKLSELTHKVCGILHKKSTKGTTITVKIRYADFTTISRSHTLPYPTDDELIIREEGVALLSKTEIGSIPVRLIGIGISNLIEHDDIIQLMLFDPNIVSI